MDENDFVSSGEFGEVIISTNNNKGSNVNIGVLGSCYSRRAFTSTDFFNPKYKNRYTVSFTQFQSSIVPLVNLDSIPIDKGIFKRLKQKEFEYVETEFKASFFERLSASNVDYLIIDLYGDSQCGVLEYSKNVYLTYTNFLYLHSNFDENGKYRLITPSADFEEYFNLFKNRTQVFVKKVKMKCLRWLKVFLTW